jgi:hypothetical protein
LGVALVPSISIRQRIAPDCVASTISTSANRLPLTHASAQKPLAELACRGPVVHLYDPYASTDPVGAIRFLLDIGWLSPTAHSLLCVLYLYILGFPLPF